MSVDGIAVIGAGHGGQAIAADLSLGGFKVNLYSRSKETLSPIITAKGIELEGKARHHGFARLRRITTNIREAIAGVGLVVVVVPTSAHSFVAETCAPYLEDRQVIFLNPGHTGGALEFREALVRTGCKKEIALCESMSITHLSRTFGPAKVRVMELTSLLFSGMPGTATDDCLSVLEDVFPGQLKPASNVLVTGFSNMNALEHPPGMIMNTGWIEHTLGAFRFYYEGVTPSIGKVIDAVDSERLSVMKALGLNPIPFARMIYEAKLTSVAEGSAYEALHNSEANQNVKSPDSLKHRYLDEDVGQGLVPMALISHAYGIDTPVMDSIITLCSVANGIDYWTAGRTLRKMGIDGLSVKTLTEYVTSGALIRT